MKYPGVVGICTGGYSDVAGTAVSMIDMSESELLYSTIGKLV